jgi:hypothetical protein
MKMRKERTNEQENSSIWTSCLTCFKETEGILDLAKSESSSSTDSWVKDLEFELRGTRFHSSKCTKAQLIPEGDKDKKTMCQCCVREERIPAETRRKTKSITWRLESKGNETKENSNQNSETLKSQIKVIVAEILRKATKAKAKKKA